MELGDIWVNKDTGDTVVVDWVSDELVSYLVPNAEKLVRTVRKFVFMQDFEILGECDA